VNVTILPEMFGTSGVRCRCSVEQFIVDAVMCELESAEEQTFLEPKTGEVIAYQHDFGSYIGCNVDKNAPEQPPTILGGYRSRAARSFKVAPER
jgi:hypothetical protein